MKKIAVILALVLLLTSAAFADGEYSDIYALYENWMENGYPDDISGVCSLGESGLCVMLTDDTPEREAEIRSMLADDSGIVFEPGKYSYNEMLAVRDEIAEKYMGKDKPVAGIGIGWTSVDGKVTGFGESGHECRVVVSVLTGETQKIAAELIERYGDMVVIESTDGYALTEDTLTSDKNTNTAWWVVLALAVLMIPAGLYFYRKKTMPVPADGELKLLTREEAASAVKKSGLTPNDSVFEEIKSKMQ